MREKTGLLDINRIENLVPLFIEDQAIVLVFLFGSYAQNQASILSDVDIAVLLSPSVPLDQYSEYRSRYIAATAKMLQDDRIDVVILNHAPPLLAHEAIKGRLLFERSAEARVEYIVNVQRHYLDLKYFYAIDHTYMRERLKEGAFGQP